MKILKFVMYVVFGALCLLIWRLLFDLLGMRNQYIFSVGIGIIVVSLSRYIYPVFVKKNND